jgi:alpha-tubulin suppressor-like RCC1 family protein
MQGNRVGGRRGVRTLCLRLRACALSAALACTLAIVSTSPAAGAPNGVAAWGYNASGQLGDGSTAISRVPKPVPGLSGVTAVAAGGEHSLALMPDGTVMAWGNNRAGQLGNGSTANRATPGAVSGLAGVVAIAAGKEHSLALLSNGTVMAWGSNEEGQLGGGTKATKSTSAVAVKGLSGVTAIAAGGEFSLARLSNGTVMAWGAGEEGQLGDGKRVKSATPMAVKGLGGVTAIAAGGEHALALLSNGTAMSWGSNGSRQLGVPPVTKIIKEEGQEFTEEKDIENSDVPVAVQALAGVKAVAAGAKHSLALTEGGEVEAWGANNDGQLGGGTIGGSSSMPTVVGGLSAVAAIGAGSLHNLALLTGGTLVSWGYNPDGQLGNNSNQNSPVPVAIAGLGGVVAVAGGGVHSLALGAPAPSVSAIEPGSGPQQGGTTVTITGMNFGEATAVRFGPSAASTFTTNSPTSITAVSPPGSGIVDVTVATSTGSSPAVAADRFSYAPAPAIAKVKPNKGLAAGGATVVISGTALSGATTVSFGATTATSFTVDSATSIKAVAPAGTAGSADITVTTPSGSSAVSKHDVFKYGSPTISALSPSAGPSEGATMVTVTGSGFAPGAGATVFTFSKATASSVLCESTTSCVLSTPPGRAGTIDVTASVGKARGKKSPPTDEFTYE